MKDIINQMLVLILPFSSEYEVVHKTAISVYMTCLPIGLAFDDASVTYYTTTFPS